MKKRIIVLFCMLFIVGSSLSGCSGKNSLQSGQTTGITEQEMSVESENQSVAEETTQEETRIYPIPEWTKNAVIYEVNVRQYTKEGTFAAFGEHLDRLREMGITTLWFMPVYPIAETERLGTLGSYYSISDYTTVNEEFGTAEDFRQLVETAQGKGFTVIMDWVANHTGWDHAWITEHSDWYLQQDGQIVSPPGMGWNDVAQLNYESKELRTAMISAMAYWVTEFDIDGFRCDYAAGVPRDFWEEARAELSQYKELYMLAEDNSSKALLVEAFDSNYNWKLYDGMRLVAKGAKRAEYLKGMIQTNLPEGTFSMNFLDNHDKNSWEGTMEELFGKDAIGALTTLIYTIPGIPLVYSGQEEGLVKSLAFFEKDEIIWQDYEYVPLLRSLAKIRGENEALYSGSYGGTIEFLTTGSENVLCYKRVKGESTILVLLNLSKDEQQVIMEEYYEDAIICLKGDAEGMKEVSKDSTLMGDGKESITLAPWEYMVAKIE